MAKEITTAMIKELRERTGVGMGKCKEALEISGGDLEEAISHLRKSGAASAVKKEGRTANEGMIGVSESGAIISLVEVNAETDFVVRNERFQEFVRNIAKEIAVTKPSSLEAFKNQKFGKDHSMTIEEYRTNLVQMIGENILIRRLLLLTKNANRSIGVYIHLGGKLVTVVELTGSSAEEAFAKDIAMHIAAASPEYLSEKDVPSAIIAHEREIAASQIKGKPENIINKIVDGKMNAFYDAACLLRQKYIRNDELTIKDLVSQRAKATGKPLEIERFIRWSVGQQV